MPSDSSWTCRRCGGLERVTGALMGFHPAGFQPKDSSWSRVFTSKVPVTASMCRACGRVDLEGDVSKL